jgi:NTP pyrophosphatase (non-canonical NTP hydrolase)
MLYCSESLATKPLLLDSYQLRARLADQNRRVGAKGLRIPLLGLFGESGSLLSQLKRAQREQPTYSTYDVSVIEELGDVLWYLSNLASRHRVPLSALARARGTDHDLRIAKSPSSTLTFLELQKRRLPRVERSTKTFEMDFFALGGAVGKLMSEYSEGERFELIDRGTFLLHLARTFRLVLRAADKAGFSLNLAAHNNLAKIESRWPKKHEYPPLLDRHAPEDEQLPRRIEMYFLEKEVNRKTYVFQRCKGINIGDRLTDNRMKKDDYRFHDVFHLAYAAILGWSPVTRALFQVKRKSDPLIDENQDGARAILIEEGIATWIFHHGAENKYFRYTTNLDYTLLKAIRTFVSGYEVENYPLWQWQRAVLEGFKVFRKLCKRRSGWVIADLKHHSISFRESPPRAIG